MSAFSQTLRRYTSLNHLAQAARAVLQNSNQINQMLADLNRVDFHNVQEQVVARRKIIRSYILAQAEELILCAVLGIVGFSMRHKFG